MTEELVGDMKDLFKSDMETQEMMAEMLENNEGRDVAETSLDVAEDLVSNIDKPERKKYVWATVFQVGKATGSDQLAEYAAKKLEEWADRHGDLIKGGS